MNKHCNTEAVTSPLPYPHLSNLLLFTGLLFILLMPNLGLADQVRTTGLTEAAADSFLGLSNIGRVKRIHVSEGEEVKQGQLLLELDQQLEQLEVKRRKLTWESDAALESATLQVKILAQHLQATRDLYRSTGSVPREELENKELEYAFAVAERNRLEVAERLEKNEYATARERLSKRNLYAPFSGKVAEVLIGIGENCETDTPLIRLVDTSAGYFVANLELPVCQKFTLEQKVELYFENGEEPIRTDASISFISPLIDPASGLCKIKAAFLNEEGHIVPGIAGELRLPTLHAADDESPAQVQSN